MTEFDPQWREDVHQIQMIASVQPTEAEQIGRVQYIAMAAAYCLAQRIGAAATAYWLKQISDRMDAQVQGRVN